MVSAAVLQSLIPFAEVGQHFGVSYATVSGAAKAYEYDVSCKA
jgi:hypothetical protein